jgi:hypothetical protein
MSDAVKSEISLVPDGDDFVLRIEANDRATSEMRLTGEHVLALAQAAPGYRQVIMSRLHRGALFAAPVQAFAAAWDGLGENILLEVRLVPSGNVIFEASPGNSRALADRLRELLGAGPSEQLTRQ